MSRIKPAKRPERDSKAIMSFATSTREPTGKERGIVNFTESTEQNETSGSKKSASNEPSRQATLTWTLQRLNRTWFISPLDEHIVLVEHPVSNGATDAQWRALIRTTGVRITSKDDARPWG